MESLTKALGTLKINELCEWCASKHVDVTCSWVTCEKKDNVLRPHDAKVSIIRRFTSDFIAIGKEYRQIAAMSQNSNVTY